VCVCVCVRARAFACACVCVCVCEEGRPKAVWDIVAGKGQQRYYWTEAFQVTNTEDRPDLSSEGAPYIDKRVNVKQKLISGHENQMGLETKTEWPTDRRS
jgi:hypothetical protein